MRNHLLTKDHNRARPHAPRESTLSPALTMLPSRAPRCASRRVTGTKSTDTHVTSPRKLSLSRHLLRLRGRRALRARRARRGLRARTAVERGHLLLHLHLQLVLLGLRLHGRRLLRDRHHALLLGHGELHFLLRRVLVVEHLLLHAGLAVERLSRVLLLLRDRGRIEVRRVGLRTEARVATHRRLRHVAHLRGP